MARIELQIELPDELLTSLRRSRKELEAEVRLAFALHLFRQRRISAGKAAELSGISLSAFMESSRQHQIPWVEYTTEELEQEIRQSVQLGEHLRNSTQ